MPNFTKNILTVYGTTDELKYFYGHNRISEEDAKYMNLNVLELSFEKCVSRKNIQVYISYIKENYILKRYSRLGLFQNLTENNSDINEPDLLGFIWGTVSDAYYPEVDLSEIELNNNIINNIYKIIYKFNTVWNYPYNWLITISQIFSNLEFEIKFSNEDDGYNMTYVYKNGVKTEIEIYSSVNKSIEDNNGIENVVNMIIDYCTENTIMIDNYISDAKNIENIDWSQFCKLYIEKYPDYKSSEILAELSCYLDDFFEKYNISNSIYMNEELCNLFNEKIKNNNL